MKRTQRIAARACEKETSANTRTLASMPLRAVVAAAFLAVGAFSTGPANALALGRMVVLSHLGEPLRAEIEIAQMTPAEASSLSVTAADPAQFKAAGLEFNPALGNLRIVQALARDGSPILRVTGSRPVNDPFLEVLLDANWASGRISRNYTLLLDPPASGASRNTAQAQVAPQIAPPPPPRPQARNEALQNFARPAPRERVTAAPARPVARPPAAEPARKVTVRAGDTAGRIAAAHKPANVSLDQMLVALLQANPDAFASGNVNRIRAGAVLDIPDGTQATAVSAPEARRLVVAQSRDFNEFRRKLASRAPAVETATPQQQSAGSVQTEVQDRRAAASTPDRLTLSKGNVSGQQADKVAAASQARDNAARAAELSRNVDELNRLGASVASSAGSSTAAVAPPSSAPATAQAASASASPAATTAVSATPASEGSTAAVTTPSVAAADAAPAPAATSPSSATATPEASNATPVAAPVAIKTTSPPSEASGFLSGLLDDMRLVIGIALLILLIIAWLIYRAVQRKRVAQPETRFLDSHLPQDSFFGASGGQHVNTTDAGAASSLATTYSPSQLDAGGDVDPLAEADVYLAYGRDLQAEEILKESLKTQPGRIATHMKLAEIYAKRQDPAAFNATAAQAHQLTSGTGEDWQRVRKLGLEVDPDNTLYRESSGGVFTPSAVALAAGAAAGLAYTSSKETQAQRVDQGLDLDLDDKPLAAPVSAKTDAELQPQHPASADALEFSHTESPFEPAAEPPDSTLPGMDPADDDFGLEFTLDTPEEEALLKKPGATVAANAPPAFDFGDLSLDLDLPVKTPTAVSAVSATNAAATPALELLADDQDLSHGALTGVSGDDAVATKLALAEEFGAIGDTDGARHLIEEVIAESSGSVRERAERMLRDLG
jgi:pilus assembly protein FimV